MHNTWTAIIYLMMKSSSYSAERDFWNESVYFEIIGYVSKDAIDESSGNFAIKELRWIFEYAEFLA